MRVLFALVALAAFAAAHHGGPASEHEIVPDLFEGQREYVYHYRSLVATGLPIKSQRYAGLENYGVLTVQVHEQRANSKVLGLRFGHMSSGSFDKEVEDIENSRIDGVSHSIDEPIERYGPVFVKVQDNEVEMLKAPEKMPEEIINMYRGIAAIFTVGKPDTIDGDNHPFMSNGKTQPGRMYHPIVYRRQEQGITGNFETIYEILSNHEAMEQHVEQLNLTKTRNYMKQIGPDGRFTQNGHEGRGCQNVCLDHKPEQLEKNMQPELSEWAQKTADGCPVNFHPQSDLVEAFTTYNYNMTIESKGKFALIHEAQALDKKILPLRKQQIKTISLIKLHLSEERGITEKWSEASATKQYNDIIYRFPEGHQWDIKYLSLYNRPNNGEMVNGEIVPMIKELSRLIASDNIDLKGETGEKIVQLTMALGSLRREDLQSLWRVFVANSNSEASSELDYVQRKVFIDALGLSGSHNASELLLDLIMKQDLSTLETVDTLQTFQHNLVRPSVKIMKMLLNVCTDTKFQEDRIVFGAACIAFAEVARTHCESPSSRNSEKWQQQPQSWNTEQQASNRCSEQEYRQFVETVRNQLHSANDFSKQTMYIQTLGRLGHPDAIKALIPYVYGMPQVVAQLAKTSRDGDKTENDSEYIQFMRQIAIFSLHHASKEHGRAVQPIVQGIYFDKQEDYELRIAALSVLIASQPSQATFGRIVLGLGEEDNLEVASFAYSALQHLANSTLPCMEQTARRVQNVLAALPDQSFGVHRSKWVAYTRYNPMTNMGLKGALEVTQSNVSLVPRAIYASLSGNKGPFVSTVANVGMISKGFENVHQLINEKGGVEKIVKNVMNRIRRDTRRVTDDDQYAQQLVQEIQQAMQFNIEEENEQFRAVVFGSYLGNEAYLPVDKEYLSTVGQKLALLISQVMSKQTADTTYRFVRILMPRTYVHVAPAVNGLPVVISSRHPIVATVSVKDIQARLGGQTKQLNMNALSVALSGFIQPTVYHTSIHSASAITALQQTKVAMGVRTVEQTYATLPLDATVQYTQRSKSFAFTVRPRFEKVFFHKTRAMTFNTKAALIRGAGVPTLDRYSIIKSQSKPFVFDGTVGQELNMPVRVQGMSEDEAFAVNFMKHPTAFRSNMLSSLIEQLSNDWVVARTWAVRVEQSQDSPLKEIKMVLRYNGESLLQQRMTKENGQQSPSQQELIKDKAEHMQMSMVSFEQEFEEMTGRKPQNPKLEESLKQIADKTQKYWSQVDGAIGKQLNGENSEVCLVEYIVSATGNKKTLAVAHGHVMLAATTSKQARLAEVKMSVEGKPYSLELQAVTASTKIPQPFETEINERQQRAILGLVAELETREAGRQRYSAKIEMSKSEEQEKFMRQPKEQRPWFYDQCDTDKKENKSEMSTACEMVRVDKSALNRLRFEIELPQQIPESLKDASHQMRESLKMRFYRNLRPANNAAENTQENKIQGELIYSEQEPGMFTADLTIRTPDHEELHFERVAVPKVLRPSTMWTLKQQVKAFLTQDQPEATCVYNGKNLRTFDNVTISLESMKTGEKHVIARDNNEKSQFTVIAETKREAGQASEIEIVLRDATVLGLTPAEQKNGASYKVRVNSTTVEVSPKKTEVRQYGPEQAQMITMHVEEHNEGQDTLVIHVRDQRMRMTYDGESLKLSIDAQQFKGQLSGLCGDMNNQHIDELTGPRGCNFEREEDFIRSFSLSNKQGHGLEGRWKCPETVYPRAASEQDIKKHQQAKQQANQHGKQQQQRQNLPDEQMIQETKMIPLIGKLCFSLKPVNSCQKKSNQLETEPQTIEFICLKQNHPRTMQIQREVQIHKVASNLPVSGQSGIVHHEIEVATRCSSQ